MKKDLLVQIFAAVQGLEKCLRISRELFDPTSVRAPELGAQLDQQERIVKQMRRQSNRLQLYVAQEDWGNVARCLDIIYGLNKMVRPEVTRTFSELSNGQVAPGLVDVQATAKTIYH